jgi:D-alanine-D-alanine ligase
VQKLKITIIYDAVEDQEKADAEAEGKRLNLVYEQVQQALVGRGHLVELLPATTDLREMIGSLHELDSDIVFNLCESLAGNNQHEQNIAALLELLNLKFTGSGSIGLALTQDKELSKKLLAFHSIRYPKYSVIDEGRVEWSDDLAFPVLLKPVDQDASFGIDDKAIVHNIKELMERISFIHTEFSSPALIEEYIEGREIYIGVLGNKKPEALPIIEWDFSKVPDGKPRIASTEAKWDENSEAYKDSFEVFPKDIPEYVYQEIQEAAVTVFRLLKLRDYARIDMRLKKTEKDGKEAWEFYIIEVNGNPHLDKESELPLAAEEHGLDYVGLIEKIVELALERSHAS